jgi:hypothetical protein
MNYIRQQSPAEAVATLILPSREVSSVLQTTLTFKLYGEEKQTESTERILWKCGFGIEVRERTHVGEAAAPRV